MIFRDETNRSIAFSAQVGAHLYGVTNWVLDALIALESAGISALASLVLSAAISPDIYQNKYDKDSAGIGAV